VLIISAHIKKRFVKLLLCQTVKKARNAWDYKAITICTKDEQYLEKSILETIFIDSKGNTIKETMYWKD
jgi:2-phospho-L-lactate guanylyltransferase (CobY/MobA/RfbA family)